MNKASDTDLEIGVSNDDDRWQLLHTIAGLRDIEKSSYTYMVIIIIIIFL